ncbi:MAG: DUF4214 domain-containing protein [Roseibium sp.]|nr:DUF4214 domain-containing protein [Roseibium sp.]
MTTSATVTQFYNNVLQRDPTASELSSWVALIDSGALTSAQALDAIVNSSEAQTYAWQVVRFYQAAFGRVPDTTGVNGWVDQLVAGTLTTTDLAVGFVLSAEWTARYGGTTVNEPVLQGLYQNVLGRQGSAAEIQAWIDTGLSLDQILIGFANSAEFQNNSNAAVTNLLTTAGNTATANIATVFDGTTPLDTTVSGDTFTLTTGTDNFTGGTGADTFDSAVIAGNMTFGASDNLDGGSGTDTLNVTTNAGTTQPAGLNSIEVVNATATGASGISFLGTSGVTNINSIGSTALFTGSNIGSSSTALGITNSSAGATFSFANTALSGSSDTAGITLNNVTGGTVTISPTSGTNGFETIGITSSGSANTITLNDGTSTSLTTLNVSGDQGLTLTTTPTTITTVNASGMTAGGLTHTTTNAGTSGITVTGSAGNDALTLGANTGNDTVDAGAGNDTVTYTGNLTNADTVNGGDGTDTLVGTSANLTALTVPTTPTITNFESLTVSNALAANLSTANVQAGLSTVNLAGGSGAFGVTMEAGSQTVNIAAANTGALTITDTGTATNDTLRVDNTATTATDVLAGQNLLINGFETTTLDTGDFSTVAGNVDVNAITMTSDTGGTDTLNIVGSATLDTAGAITAEIIDASGLTGTAALNMGAAAVGVTSITGSAGNDTLLGDASSSIIGGAGNDTITGGTGNDVLDGGDGNDAITTNTGNDTVTGGAGNDTATFGANFGSGDALDGGDGTDTLSVTNASLTTLAGLTIGQINTLNGNVSNVEQVTLTDALNQGTFDVARLDSISNITTNTWTGAETLTGLAGGASVTLNDGESANAANALTLALADSSGSSDTLTVNLVNNASNDFENIAVSGIETLNVTTAEATATTTAETHVLDIAATGLSTLTLTGTEGLNLSGAAINATTIDASGIADATAGTAPSVNILGAGADQTITGTAGADTIDAGAGADTILGGGGADTLTGGAGADTITGGEGADDIIGGAGDDQITLTETTATVDEVRLTHSERGADVDVITGFTTGTGGDQIEISLGALESNTVTGIFTAATNFEELQDGTDVAAGAATLELITGAATISAGTDIIGLQGATFSSADSVEDALEVGGAFALTVNALATAANSAFMIVYTDGTNAKVAAVHAVNQTAADTDFEAGDLNVIDLATIEGVSAIGATTFVSTNFEFIA